MTGTPYQQGTAVTIGPATLIVGTTPADPTTVTFRVRLPDDTLQTFVYGVDMNVTKLSTGIYELAYGIPPQPGEYYYDCVGTGAVEATLPGDFYVIGSSVVPAPQVPGPVMAPCTAWLAGEDLVGVLGSQGLDAQQLDSAAVVVSMLAFECFGRRWTGLCGPVTVRPCPVGGCASVSGWGSGAWTWGYWQGDWGYDWGWGDTSGRRCSCGYDSTVELAGYPVTQITQVKVGGQILPTTYLDSGAPTYRLDEWRYLTRLADPYGQPNAAHWPRCQRLDINDDQPGTWSVTYLYGVAPPPPALAAATQLASQVMLAMNGQACQLPNNVRTAVRQGATIERITPLAVELKTGATGMLLWDSAIAAYNPSGLRRAPSVFSPDTRFPVRTGSQ